jgi:SAM-dependent methyltransferase
MGAHLRYQRHYYEGPQRLARIAPVRSPYVTRHLDETLRRLAPSAGARLLELGCGMGRFTLPLAERGFQVTGADLVPELLDHLRESDPDGSIQTVCCDAAEIDRHATGPFDGAVGFFFLHHLEDLEAVFAGVARLLRPGGRVAWAEPNGLNPLFYLQIAVTRGMTWRGDGGVRRMRPGVVLPALRRAGFGELAVARYGLFPPAISNHRAGARLEGLLERVPLWRPLLAFQVFTGTLPG